MVPETLYLTINLIDRYLQGKQVRRSRFQLLGVSALLVSLYQAYHPKQLTEPLNDFVDQFEVRRNLHPKARRLGIYR
jgi:hypothetical protein